MKKYLLCSLLSTFFMVKRTEAQSNSSEVTFQIDQDYFNYANDDRNYTMGIYLGFSSYCLKKFPLFPCLSKISEKISKCFNPEYDNFSYGNNSMAFYFGGFTPDSIGTKSIVYGDRPFGSVTCLNGSVSYSFIRKTNKNVANIKKYEQENPDMYKDYLKKWRFKTRNVSLALGVIGLPFGQPLQGFFHRRNEFYKDTLNYTNPMYPYGWDNQISNGGGLTGLLQFSGSRLITNNYLSRFIQSPTSNKGWTDGINDRLNYFQRHFELKAGYQFMLGYYNKAEVNLEARFGKINPMNWANSWTNNSTHSAFTRSDVDKPKSKRNAEIFMFGSIRGNFMRYNSLLQGQLFDFLIFGEPSKYTLSNTQVQRIYASASVGLALRVGGVYLSYTPIALRTTELKTIDKYMRTHQWGEVCMRIKFENHKTKKYQ